MAYADANTNNRKLSAGAAVLLLEAGLAWAIVTGLTMTFTRTEDEKLVAFTPTKEPEPKTIEPVKPKPDTQTHQAPPQHTDTTINLGPTPMPTTTFDEGLGDGGFDKIELPHPTPPAPPPPRFTPKLAMPKGKMANWVTDNDYPTSELRQNHEGRTAYRLSIDSTGKVTNCTVTASSGWPGLDKAACDKLSSRAKFEAATNADGERVAGVFSSAVTWRIPPEE